MRAIGLALAAITLAYPAFAGVVKESAIACAHKNELDALTVLAANGQMDVLAKTENRLVTEKKCIRLSKGAQVDIVNSKRVFAGEQKITGNAPHHRIAYHMASVTAEGKPWVMHLFIIDASDKAGH